MSGVLPRLSQRGQRGREGVVLSNCCISKKSAQSWGTLGCRLGLGPAKACLGVRSTGCEEALCVCVLNYLYLSDEVSKRA